MKKKTKYKTVKLIIKVEVPYYAFPDEKLNKKTERSIKRWIKETLHNEAGYIPIYDEEGEEWCTRLAKYRFK